MRLGKLRGRSAPAGRTAPAPPLIPWSSRRPTSPAPCIWATRSTIRCRTSCAGSSACAARMCCGSRGPITPASLRKPWSSGSSWNGRSRAAPWGARLSSSVCGSGKRSRAAPSSASSSASAHHATGRASASPWMKACRARCSRSSSRSTARASFTRTSGSSTGTPS